MEESIFNNSESKVSLPQFPQVGTLLLVSAKGLACLEEPQNSLMQLWCYLCHAAQNGSHLKSV